MATSASSFLWSDLDCCRNLDFRSDLYIGNSQFWQVTDREWQSTLVTFHCSVLPIHCSNSFFFLKKYLIYRPFINKFQDSSKPFREKEGVWPTVGVSKVLTQNPASFFSVSAHKCKPAEFQRINEAPQTL